MKKLQVKKKTILQNMKLKEVVLFIIFLTFLLNNMLYIFGKYQCTIYK